jgi:hypothetical protein
MHTIRINPNQAFNHQLHGSPEFTGGCGNTHEITGIGGTGDLIDIVLDDTFYPAGFVGQGDIQERISVALVRHTLFSKDENIADMAAGGNIFDE